LEWLGVVVPKRVNLYGIWLTDVDIVPIAEMYDLPGSKLNESTAMGEKQK
jgi:hypothetical protein